MVKIKVLKIEEIKRPALKPALIGNDLLYGIDFFCQSGNFACSIFFMNQAFAGCFIQCWDNGFKRINRFFFILAVHIFNY